MAAEFVLTFAAEGVLTKLTSLAAQEFGLAWGFKAELTKLRKTVSIIQGYLAGVADQPQSRGQPIEDWVKQLKDIAQDADDVFDEFQYEVVRRKVEIQNHMKKKVLNFFSLSNPIVFRLKLAHKILKINASLVDLESKASVIGLVSKKIDATPQGIRRKQTDSFLEKDEIMLGRDTVLSDIVTTLTDSKTNQENLSVMAIVGMAGLGKTTLAKLVCNNDSIKNYFSPRIWVCVSDSFDVNVILVSMLESLNPTKATIRESQDALLRCLEEELKEKRYLLVLDDVWNQEQEKWGDLMSSLSKLNSAQGSKILVTTRSARVASISKRLLPPHNLDSLSIEDCWSIIKNRAFTEDNAHIAQDLEKIGREIAKNCAGVPLMAKVLGSMLRFKNSIEGWLLIKESRIWDLPEGEEKIISVLKLSFDNLKPPSLKQCFAYCSVFKKDIEIDKNELIQLWMAQGLLHSSLDKSNVEMEDIGNEYFDILLQSSLFQDALYYDGNVVKCKMHDLVHDLVEHVSKSEILNETDDTLETIQHVSWVSTSILERIQKRSVGRLYSLFSDVEVLDKMLPGFKALRVLKLYGANVEELPTSVGKLKHLRYLDISQTRIKTLPKSFGKLYNLQTLRASGGALKEFPKEVQNLINLRHVYFDWSMKFPVGMGRLTCLRTLPHFSVGTEVGRGIEELGGLGQLSGNLFIYDLEHVRDGDEARTAKLVEKKNVGHFKFAWKPLRSTSNNEEDVLENLQPHPELESLCIENFMGAKFPSWMMSRSLPLKNMKKIELVGCKKCEEVPAFGHLPNLTVILIASMNNLKCIGAEFYGYDHVSDDTDADTTSTRTLPLFPALRRLYIHYCRDLTEWMESPTQKVVVFPCLEELVIRSCPKLGNAPSHFPCLKKLEIDSTDQSTAIKKISSGLSTLTCLRISNMQELTCLPEGMLKNKNNLTTLKVSNCDKMTCITPDVFGCCVSLRQLDVINCRELRHLPDGLDTLPLLEDLSIEDCPSLELIPITHGMASLRELWIFRCEGLSGLPGGLEYCTSLLELTIGHCNNVTSIDPITQGPASLQELSIDYCNGLSGPLPIALAYCASLTSLRIRGCPNLTSIQIPHGDGGVFLSSIQILSIEECDELSTIPDLEYCPSLRELVIWSCPKLTSICSPSTTSRFVYNCLENLWIRNCSGLQSIPDVQSLTSLRELQIENCERLESLVSSIGLQIPVSLERLTIAGLPNLESIPSLDNLTSLCELKVYDCGKLKYLPAVSFSNLKELEIGGFWDELDSFPDFLILSQLERLVLKGWPKLKSLPQQFQHYTSLTYLRIQSFDRVEAVPEWLGNLTSLEMLVITDCENLMYLPTFKAMQRLTNLTVLVICGCPLLQLRCTKDSGLEWPKISHIPNIDVEQV